MKLLLRLFGAGLAMAVLFVALTFSVIKIQSAPYIKASAQDLPQAHTAIVLGAAILYDGDLSQIFKDRADTAVSLFREKKVKTILVSGDDGTTTHNEVNPAREYLLSKGVPTDAIFLDHAGFDTYSSMYRARDIFLVDSAIITTQSFHLPRAVFIARRLGIKAYGLPADQHGYAFKNNIREVFADVKAIFNVIMHRRPKYLGEEIPITGDSSESI
jgi:SanA protein